MVFGDLGLEDIVGNGHGAPSLSPIPYETQTLLSTESKPIKRSLDSADEDELKSCTVPKTDYLSNSTTNTMSLHQATAPLLRTNSFVSTDYLSASTTNTMSLHHSLVSTDASLQNHMTNFSLLKSEVPHMYTRYAGYGSATVNASMHAGVNGQFTPSQIIELQHHALIYKYISCNMRVPSNLLIPLKKSIYAYGFTSSPARPLAYKSLGWGSFHLRYTGNTDPEPGRCRRMDGKKWRCSRDAVANQKYCERHLNRGRNRSRKPVEGQTRHAASSKVVPMSSSMLPSMNTIAGVANSLEIARQHQFKSLQSGATKAPPDTIVNRSHSDSNLKSNNSTFTITKQGVAFGESSVASGSLVSPLHRTYYTNSKEHTSQETQDELKPHWTKLSPMPTSSSLPAKQKLELSSLSLSGEFDRIQMGFGVNNNDQNKKQADLNGGMAANNVGSCTRTLLSEGWNGSTSYAEEDSFPFSFK